MASTAHETSDSVTRLSCTGAACGPKPVRGCVQPVRYVGSASVRLRRHSSAAASKRVRIALQVPATSPQTLLVLPRRRCAPEDKDSATMFECVARRFAVHGLLLARAFAARICRAHNRVLPAGAGGPPSRLSAAAAQQLELLSTRGAARFAVARRCRGPAFVPRLSAPWLTSPCLLPAASARRAGASSRRPTRLCVPTGWLQRREAAC